MKKFIKLFAVALLTVSCVISLGACGNDADANDGTVSANDVSTGDVSANDISAGDVSANDEATEPAKEPKPYVDKLDRSDEGYVLVWNDEFDGDALDTTKWDYMYGNGGEYGKPGWGNQELQYYHSREENVRVENGELIITAVHEPGTVMPYTSGRIRTMKNNGEVLFATTYGRVEARIKVDAEDGLWPAFWMLPVDESVYGAWAASGELDIMEAKGRLEGEMSVAAHYGGKWPLNTYSGTGYVFEDGTTIEDYHLYSMEWDPDEIRYYVDNELIYTLRGWFSTNAAGEKPNETAPFDADFYIILNLAVGGTFDPQSNIKNAELPAEMVVDFVRVYHREEGYGKEAAE